MDRNADARPRRSPAGGIARCLTLVLPIVVAQPQLAQSAASQPSAASESVEATAPNQLHAIAIVLARQRRDLPPPLSLLDMPPADDGVAGARLAINDNNTTGRFLKQEFKLEIVEKDDIAELVEQVKQQVEHGVSFIVADASPQAIVALADALKDRRVLILNAGSRDDRLREQDCRANVVHTAPSRAMLADALAQYLVWKRWQRWLLVYGTEPDDQAFAAALRRAAKRFGAKIVEERPFKPETGSRRADGGHEQIQQQIPTFTQNAPTYDVLMVADEGGQFGEYFPYRSWDARPVAGTNGLVPMSWHPALEQWGATQFQNRFRRLANRPMRPLDYDVWVAIRSIGEAATRVKSAEPAAMIAHLKSADFDLAAFKGRRLNYRAWDGQLRQPILIATAKLPVTVSPQPGFLHQFSELDTLGIDKPETSCRVHAR